MTALNIISDGPSPFQRYAPRLLEAGFHPIPILPREKIPGQFTLGRWEMMSGWTDYRTRAPSSFEIRMWSGWPNANIGIVLGTRVGQWQVVAIDYDTDDAEQLEVLSATLPNSPMMKKGARGFTAFYLADLSVKTKRYMVKKRAILEILTGNATRQTVVAPSIHPSGHAYAWMTPAEIVPASTLPVLTADQFEDLEDALTGMGWGGEEVARKEIIRLDSADPSVWRQTNNAALDNMDAWVPQLGLYKTRRTAGGYEAVPTWRASNGGQALEVRKLNLKMHKTGIKDMGTDEKFTPLNLCCRVFNWDLDTSFRWLRSQLGIEDGKGTVHAPVKPPRLLAEMEDGAIVDTSTGQIVEEAPKPVSEPVEAVSGLSPVAVRQEEEKTALDRLLRPEGLLGDLIDWIDDTSRQPCRVMSLGPAITVLGTLMGRRTAGPTLAGTSLFVLTLAPTATGKQHGLTQSIRLMQEVGAAQHIGPGEFISMPSVINFLLRSPLGLCGMDEFGAFFQRINSRKASGFEESIKKILRSVWGTNYATMMTPEWANKAGVPIYAPAISIYGVSTPEEFYKSLDNGDVENGVLNRFMILKTDEIPPKGDPKLDPLSVPASISEQLKAIYKGNATGNLAGANRNTNSVPVRPDVVPWTPAAKEVHKAHDDFIMKARTTNFELSPFLGREAEIALRLATIHAVCRDMRNPVLDVVDMEWGRDMARWSSDNMSGQAADYMSESTNQSDTNGIIRILKKHKGSMSRSALLLANKHRLKAKDLNEILASLQDSGQIAVDNIVPMNGGPATKRYTLQN